MPDTAEVPHRPCDLGHHGQMRASDAKDIAVAAQIDPTYYSFEGDRHEALCVLAQGQEWHVFLSERGQRHEEQTFASEDEACVFFLRRLFQLTRKG
jgi:hypothetical protein